MPVSSKIRPLLLTAGLAALALAGNVFNLPLFFGVDFLFGSVFVFIALHLLGLASGMVVALAAGAYTVVLWGHPYALIGLLLETLFVGVVLRKNQDRNLPAWVMIYWLVFGIAFIALAYHLRLGVPWQSSGMVAFKQAANDIFNALVATFVIQYLPARLFLGSEERRGQRIHHLQTNLLVAFAFLPALVVIAVDANKAVETAKNRITHNVVTRTEEISTQVSDWQRQYIDQLEALGHQGSNIGLRDLQLVLRSNPDILFLHLVDTDGKIRLSTSEDKTALKVIDYSDREWFRTLVDARKPVASDAIIGRTSGLPVIAVAVPILDGQSLAGVMLTSVEGETLLKRIVTSYKADDARITLVDSKGNIIGSTNPAFKPLQSFEESRGGKILERAGTVYRWQPSGKASAMQEWANSYYAIDSSQGMGGWTVVVEQPLLPYASELQYTYLLSFAVVFSLAVVAFLLGSRVGRLVSGPLGQLSQAATRMSGDISSQTELALPVSNVVEIAALTEDFRQMSSALRSSYAELEGARDELEQRVLERTEELQRQRYFLEKLIDVIPGMVGYWTNEERCSFANSGYQEWFDKTNEQMIGISMRDLMGDELYSQNEAFIRGALRGGTQRFERAIKKADGTIGYVWAHYIPDIKNGRVNGFFVLVSDITEIKMAQVRLQELNAELQTARDEAEHANQAKSQFLSSMSHELRTPMNAILGFAQLLDMDRTVAPEHHGYIREMLKAGNHLLALINDVLDLAKIESGQIDMSLEPVELFPLVEECLELMAPLAQARGVQLSHAGLQGAAVRADRVRLKQSLINLVSNAIKYNRDAGMVRIELQPAGEGRLRTMVTDSGVGIPAEHMTGLFEPFNRLGAENTSIEGTGIGLSITKRIVEMMGGAVGADSEVGAGSRFWIDLPLESEPCEVKESEAKGISIDAKQPEIEAEHVVLYIEDNPANLKLVAELLGYRKHIHLLTAHTPQLGIELAMARRPKLILLDINMPGMDGYQVLQTFKNNADLKSTPIVALTANVMARDIDRGINAGFTDYLTKPLDIPRFYNVVDQLLGVGAS